MSAKKTSKEIQDEITAIHGEVFTFENFVYDGKEKPFIITCPIHGDFESNVKNIIRRKNGCSKCSGFRMDTETFIQKGIEKHGELYDYSKSVYINSRTKIIILCPAHGEFEMTPANHLMGQSCKACHHERYSGDYTKRIEKFIEESKDIHGDLYDYRESVYVSNAVKIKIFCNSHQEFFWQIPHNHLRGKGCIKCGSLKSSMKRTTSTEEFIEKSRKIHGDKYDYSLGIFVASHTPFKLVCPTHGEFEQHPAHHLRGSGCPTCSKCESTWEIEMKDFIKGLGFNADKNKSIINPFEIDIYIPEKNIAFECNGLYWHSELNGKHNGYHLKKSRKCLEKGVKLYHIFEDEWRDRQSSVESFIKMKLGVAATRIFARNCEIKIVNNQTRATFLEENHLQGAANSNIALGLYHDNVLVSIMTFIKDTNYEWDLNRFCNKADTIIVGGASKLLSHFIEEHSPTTIVSRANKRFSEGNLYKTLGFNHISDSEPSYYYTDYVNKWHKRGFQHKCLKNKLENYDPNSTEWKNMQAHGYDRIWDCGTMKFVWKNHANS